MTSSDERSPPRDATDEQEDDVGLNIQDLAVTCAEFDAGGRIPERHANDKDNDAPTVRVEGVPDGTAELALICHDPDAPLPHGFTHWTLYGIPADTTTIGPDGDEAYRPGPNDFGFEGWGGPQPPEGHGDHHYYFWIYALSRPVEGQPSRQEFLERYGDAIIEQNRIVGTYSN